MFIHHCRRGFWFSHVGWILSADYMRTDLNLVRDFRRNPEICFLNRFYWIPPFVYALLMYSVWGFPGLVWGFFISTTALYHCTFFINSLTHMIGRVRYKSNDGSKNSFILAILCCGEGWHNNHHHYQSAVNQGWFWWEVDLSYYILSLLSWFGIVWDLRTPPEHIKARTIAVESGPPHGAHSARPIVQDHNKISTARPDSRSRRTRHAMNHKQVIQQLLDKAQVQINGTKPGDILVHNDGFYNRVLAEGSLGTWRVLHGWMVGFRPAGRVLFKGSYRPTRPGRRR